MASVLDEKSIPIVANPDGPDIFADGAVGAFLTNGNVHITLVARRCDYSSQPSTLSDVVIGRLVMPLPAAEKMASFLGDCLETMKRQTAVETNALRTLQ
jgi:hypothetical protein